MYILRKPLALSGMAIVALSTIFTPFLRVPIKGNWNLYELDTSLFMVTYGILGLCVLAFFLRKVSFFRIVSRVFFVWTIIGFLGVYFKINNFFGMKLVDGMLSKTLHLKWGWLVFFLGALLMLLSVKKVKPLATAE